MSQLISDYKKLHTMPEPGFAEHRTSAFIKERLQEFPDISFVEAAGTGIIAYKKGAGKGTRAFRADMDGLPIKEATGLDYASENPGFMHACGHDAHMAILLELISRVSGKSLEQDLLFIFQPAEEGPGGAGKIMEHPFFIEHRPDVIYGLHVHPDLPEGGIGSRAGSFFGSATEFYISLKGEEAHAGSGSPKNALHAGVEAAASALETAAQEIKNRYVLHFGRFNSGVRENIIAPDALISGTIRAFLPEDRTRLREILEHSFREAAGKRELELDMRFPMDYPVLTNHEGAVQDVRKACNELGLEYTELEAYCYGEDFAFYLEQVPGVFFILGVDSEKARGSLHTRDFCFDPACLVHGADIMECLAFSDEQA